ncbi:hypothetical protein Hanom_Chr10g00960361 [Helianthus anomalus]
MWAFEPLSMLLSAGVPVSSAKVAELLVSHLYWSNNVPIATEVLPFQFDAVSDVDVYKVEP